MPRPQFEKFKRWAPDQGVFGTGQTEEVVNVVRTSTGFRPFPGIIDNGFDALPGGPDAFPTGFFFGKTVTGNAQQFVAIYDPESTVNSKVYELTTDGRWNVVSTWNVGSDIRFRTSQWDDVTYICNLTNGLRSTLIDGTVTDFTPVNYQPAGVTWSALISYASGTEVVHLGVGYVATAQTTIGNDPLTDTLDEWAAAAIVQIHPKFMAVVRDFLVIGNMDDDASPQPNRVRWSGINQPSSFSRSGDATTLSDFQDLPDAGAVQGIVGGEYATVLCENGIFRMDFVGPPAIFSFNRIERARGCIEPNSVVIAADVTYYLSDDGWRSFDGQQVTTFGAERFDRFFRATAIQSELPRMSVLVNPNQQTIIWGHHTAKEIVDRNDRTLIYNYAIREATLGHLDHSLFGTFITPALDIDSNNIRLVRELQDTDAFKAKWDSTVAYTAVTNDVVTYHPSPPATHVWKADWQDATIYAVDDLVYLKPVTADNTEDDVFICTAAHTSSLNYAPRAGHPTSTVTISVAVPAVVTWTAHGLPDDSPVVFSTTGQLPAVASVGGADPMPLVPGRTYYVSAVDANSFNIALAPAGTPIDTVASPAQLGVHTAVGATDWRDFWDQLAGESECWRCTVDTSASVTITVANPGVVTWTAHGFSIGDTVSFAGADLPEPIVAGQAYFVESTGTPTVNDFTISATLGGAAIQTTDAGTPPFTGLRGNPPPYDTTNWEEAKGTPITVTMVGSPNAVIVEWTEDATLDVNAPVHFTTTGELPDPLVVDRTYYVLPLHSHVFNLADHPDGDPILITDIGSGTHTAEALVVCPIEQMGKVPWDSSVFKPDAQIFGTISKATDGSNKLHIFSGFPDECILTTPEFRPAAGRSRLHKLQLAIEGDSATIEAQLESRNELSKTPLVTPYRAQGPDQSFRFNIDARYHRIRVRITGPWRDGTGVFHESTPTSDR